MDPPHINYVDHQSILIVNPSGAMKQLFVPFQVKVAVSFKGIPANSLVMVEEVMPHQQHRIIYRIYTLWLPYWYFTI